MEYQFSECHQTTNGDLIIPLEKVSRWMRQTQTSYSDLSEQEKYSDREQAHKIINFVSKIL